MARTLTYIFQSQCPYLDKLHSISIDYEEILMCGTTKPGYKKGNYYCDEADNCPFPSNDKWGRCPVYLNSPSEPS